MKACTNYYSAINSVEYSGVFVGGYANNGARLDFIDCDNYGTFYGPKLGYLLGNDNNKGIASITAEGCDNYGALYASQQVGFVCFAHDGNLEGSTAYQVYEDKGTNTEGTLVVLEPIEANVVSDAETISSIEIISSGDFDKFEIVASGYATMHNQNGGYAGTLLMRVSSGKKDKGALSDIGFGKFGFIEKSKVSDSDITTGETFSTAEFEGKTYYVIDLTAGELSQGLTASFEPDGILTNVKYTLYLYKTEGELEKLAGSYSIPLE